MSKPPYEFESEKQLRQKLGCKSTEAAANNFFNKKSETVNDVVKDAVAGNTYRAFSHLPVKPSVAFREWAENYITESFQLLCDITEASDYSKYVYEATDDLCDKWRRRTHSKMGFGRGAKLFNLVLKKFACLSSLTEEQKNTLISLQHVPLDKYTIVGLRLVAPDLSIPKNATMGYIDELNDELKHYEEFQNVISKIAGKARVPAIYYDILAWNMSHSIQKPKLLRK